MICQHFCGLFITDKIIILIFKEINDMKIGILLQTGFEAGDTLRIDYLATGKPPKQEYNYTSVEICIKENI